jgi:ribosomal protein S7
MSTPAQIGKTEYNAAILDGRKANHGIRNLVKRIMRETDSNLIKALAGSISLSVGDNEEAIARLDEIGKTLKESKER